MATSGWRSLIGRLNSFAGEKPILFSSFATGTTMSLGDYLCQRMEGKDFSGMRNLRFAVVGLIYIGPTLRLFYGALDRRIVQSALKPYKMLLIDQAIFAPCFLPTVVISTKLALGMKFDTILASFLKDYKDALLGNYTVWPLAQFISFRFLPLDLRVLFGNFVAIFWNCYVSYISNRKEKLPKGTAVQ